MDSKLDPVFRTAFRHAETLDTRLGIRREEPQGEHGRRRDDDAPREQDDPWQDITTVSIQALRTFLADLLGQAGHAPVIKTDMAAAPAAGAHNNLRQPADPAAARAAGAYRATAGAPPAAPPAPAATGPAITLSPDEIRTIHTLIGDLERLSSRHIEELRIEKNGSFLDSLAVAARTALAAGG